MDEKVEAEMAKSKVEAEAGLVLNLSDACKLCNRVLNSTLSHDIKEVEVNKAGALRKGLLFICK
jgi:hypothetical protein